MRDLNALFGAERSTNLPQSAECAVLIYGMFAKLGGYICIDHKGRRQRMLPCTGTWSKDNPYPQMPDAHPCEQFHSGDEWAGALKLMDYLFVRLDKADRDFIYDAFAAVSTPYDVEQAKQEAQ